MWVGTQDSRRLGWSKAWLVWWLGMAGCATGRPTPEIIVVGSDYAFSVADAWPAGRTLVRFQNIGSVPHEMVLGRLRQGASPAEFADSLVHDRRVTPLLDGGTAVLFAGPNESSDPQIGVTLVRGRNYALWCQFDDGPGHPKHMKLGMIKLLTVR